MNGWKNIVYEARRSQRAVEVVLRFSFQVLCLPLNGSAYRVSVPVYPRSYECKRCQVLTLLDNLHKHLGYSLCLVQPYNACIMFSHLGTDWADFLTVRRHYFLRAFTAWANMLRVSTTGDKRNTSADTSADTLLKVPLLLTVHLVEAGSFIPITKDRGG